VSLPRTDGLPSPRRYWAVVGLWIGMGMSVLDSSVTNIALPTIARDLASDPAKTVWVVTAYQIAIVMSLLPVAALGERYGFLRVYAIGLLTFLTMSLACALAPTLELLAVFRFAQGFGAAAMMGVNGALMRYVWPKAMLGRGVGYNAMVIACTAAAGPGLAGIILAFASWPWLFLINIPLGIVAFTLSTGFGPATPPETALYDRSDAVLSAAMLGTIFFALSDLSHGHWSWRAAVVGVIGLAIGMIVVKRARTAQRPLIPFDLFRLAPLRNAYGASITAFAAQTSLFVALPFLLEHGRGLSSFEVGLLVLPMPIGLAAMSPVAGRLADRSWAGWMSAAGLLLVAAMLAGVAVLMMTEGPLWLLATCMAIAGMGFGLFQAPNNSVMLRKGPFDRAGAAGGMLAQSRLIGQTAGALISSTALSLRGPASTSALLVGAGCAIVAALFATRRSPVR
jgi:DHA2 family multidrug resistance protein-like MFS transporter